MDHNISLITTIAAALGLGLMLGMLAVRLRLPALVGYLAAGVIIGPATPGFVADVALASQLAEIGVMLLMFGVGLHFSLDDLLEVKGPARRGLADRGGDPAGHRRRPLVGLGHGRRPGVRPGAVGG
jgi:CPA2 family monovalent cation:H+ antiporter-2